MKAAFVFLFCLCSFFFFFQWIKKDCCFFLFRIECIRARQRLNDQFVKLKFPFISFNKGHALHLQFIQGSNYHYARIIMRKKNLTRRKTRRGLVFFTKYSFHSEHQSCLDNRRARNVFAFSQKELFSIRISTCLFLFSNVLISFIDHVFSPTRHIDPMRYSERKKKSSFRITIVYL